MDLFAQQHVVKQSMSRFARSLAYWMLAVCTFVVTTARADDARSNHGNDPFFQISHGIAGCPVPLGPMQTEREWLANSHNRIEHGNSCWTEGRCRLMNAYYYDKEIAETVQRRLRYINTLDLHWEMRSTLWLMIQSRVIFVQGCVSGDFNKQRFLSVLSQTADVDRVVDNTTTDPTTDAPPYRTQANPDRLPPDAP